MLNTFQVGNHVARIAFVDCFGRQQDSIPGLVVEEVTEHARMGLPPYYRVFTRAADGGFVEGAERFFQLESAIPSNDF
jgi:hypothetical protein